MADETVRCDKLEAQLNSLRSEFDRRTEVRDGEVSELRDALTDLAARLSGVEKAADKSPSWTSVFSALATSASLVAGIGYFTLSQTTSPIAGDVLENRDRLDHFMADLTGAIKLVNAQLDDTRQRLSRVEGKLGETDKTLERLNGKGD